MVAENDVRGNFTLLLFFGCLFASLFRWLLLFNSQPANCLFFHYVAHFFLLLRLTSFSGEMNWWDLSNKIMKEEKPGITLLRLFCIHRKYGKSSSANVGGCGAVFLFSNDWKMCTHDEANNWIKIRRREKAHLGLLLLGMLCWASLYCFQKHFWIVFIAFTLTDNRFRTWRLPCYVNRQRSVDIIEWPVIIITICIWVIIHSSSNNH